MSGFDVLWEEAEKRRAERRQAEEDAEKRGEERGEKRGEKRGTEEAFHTVAERLIQSGYDGNTIVTATGYDRNQIDTIARSLNRTVTWSKVRA